MKYGGAVALLVIGAILYFAVNIQLQVVDISMVGLILMVAGGIWLMINFLIDAGTRRT